MVSLEKRSFNEIVKYLAPSKCIDHGWISGEGESSSIDKAFQEAKENLTNECDKKKINYVCEVKNDILRGAPCFRVITYGKAYEIK